MDNGRRCGPTPAKLAADVLGPGREPVKPGVAAHRGGSILDLPMVEILRKLSERCPTARSRALAKRLQSYALGMGV